jgi:hypothetical protein
MRGREHGEEGRFERWEADLRDRDERQIWEMRGQIWEMRDERQIAWRRKQIWETRGRFERQRWEADLRERQIWEMRGRERWRLRKWEDEISLRLENIQIWEMRGRERWRLRKWEDEISLGLENMLFILLFFSRDNLVEPVRFGPG